MPKVCEWTIKEVGNWYSEYECQVCQAVYTTEPEDLKLPADFPCYLIEQKDD